MILTREWRINLIVLGYHKGLEFSTMARALRCSRNKVAGVVDYYVYKGKELKPIRKKLPRKEGRLYKLCTVEDCQNLGRYHNGLCKMHYTRWVRHGTTDLVAKVYPRQKSISPIYENIMNLRDGRSWGSQTLAREAHIGTATLYNIASYDPSLETLRAIGIAFNVDYWRLLIPGEFEKKESEDG